MMEAGVVHKIGCRTERGTWDGSAVVSRPRNNVYAIASEAAYAGV